MNGVISDLCLRMRSTSIAFSPRVLTVRKDNVADRISTLAPFSRNSGVGHSGLWPPLHCGDSKHPAPEVVPGASLHSEALSPECGRECPGTGDCEPTRHVGAGLRGLLLADCYGLLGRRHPGPRLSHMVGWGWGSKYRDSQIFVRGIGMCRLT